MSRKATQLYDFSIAAGASFDLPVDANFYKVLTSSGDLAITRDGGSTVRPMRAGRGERNIDFKKLILRDISGAPNSGTILVGDSGFIDDTIVLSSSVSVRPESMSPNYASINTMAANTPEAVFLAAANTGGAIIYNARFVTANAGGAGTYNAGFVSKAGVPTNILDGDVLVGVDTYMGAASNFSGKLGNAVLIPAGKGLHYISQLAESAAFRNVSYKLL